MRGWGQPALLSPRINSDKMPCIMKNLLYLLITITFLGIVSCSESKDEYIIKGTTSQSRLNGKKVFLSPFGKPGIRDSIGVDSAYIKDGRFEIRSALRIFL